MDPTTGGITVAGIIAATEMVAMDLGGEDVDVDSMIVNRGRMMGKGEDRPTKA